MFELAALLLQQPVDVVNKGIATGTTNRRALTTPVAVFLVYQTAYADPDGTIEYQVTAFSATLDGNPESNLVNFVRVRALNRGNNAAVAHFGEDPHAAGLRRERECC